MLIRLFAEIHLFSMFTLVIVMDFVLEPNELFGETSLTRDKS